MPLRWASACSATPSISPRLIALTHSALPQQEWERESGQGPDSSALHPTVKSGRSWGSLQGGKLAQVRVKEEVNTIVDLEMSMTSMVRTGDLEQPGSVPVLKVIRCSQ